MCGIVGQISQNKVKDSIIECLQKLEYRGYDSCGICFFHNNKLMTNKQVGEIHNLEKTLKSCNQEFSCAIAHTRWATHGKVSKANAHPQLSNNGSWAVVHNGIVENYAQLKDELKKYGYQFFSQTDTEVIPNLISNEKNQNDPNTCFFRAVSKLSGSYAILAMCENLPNTLFLAKKHSPLYVATRDGEVMCASDPICFAGKFENYFTLSDNEFCKATPQNLTFFDKNFKKITKKAKKLENFVETASKNNHKYFAEKEIEEIPCVLRNVISHYSNSDILKKIDQSFLRAINKIYLVGCGTSFHACQIGANLLQKASGIVCLASIASEFAYNEPLLGKNTLCIFVSQSGETADTLLSLNLAKKHGSKTISLVNVPYSTMASSSDITLPLCAGAEIAVVSTKAYNAMLFVFFILSCHLSNICGKQVSNIEELESLFKLDMNNLKTMASSASKILDKNSKVFFLGRHYDHITSCEASLKLKEISYINSISIPSGELKHGTLALVDKKSIVFISSTNDDLFQKNLSTASEVKARGAKVIFVTNQNIKSDKNIDLVIDIPNFSSPEIMSMGLIVFYQYLAVETCLNFGLNPDKPRNLAKSVTVE